MSPRPVLPRWKVCWEIVNDPDQHHGVSFVDAPDERAAEEAVQRLHPNRTIIATKIVRATSDPIAS